VIRDAVRRLKVQEMHNIAWRHAIEQGDSGSDSDIPYESDTVRQIVQDANRARAGSEPVDPDVLP
jgi:Arc/MetJ-type ribon-helix-helix transcriptional regulator